MRVSVVTLAFLGLFLAFLVVEASGYRQRDTTPSEFNLDILRGGAQDLISKIRNFIRSLMNDPNFQRNLGYLYKQLTNRLRGLFQY